MMWKIKPMARSRPNRNRILIALICSLFFSSASAQVSVEPGPGIPVTIQNEIPSLYESLSKFFPVGAAIRVADISGPHAELLKKHFNSITAENAMKWSSLERVEGQLDFTTADALVAFARANRIRVRGHNLVWHEQVPAWVFQSETGEELRASPESKSL